MIISDYFSGGFIWHDCRISRMGRSGQAGLVLIPRGFVYIFNVLLAVKSISLILL